MQEKYEPDGSRIQWGKACVCVLYMPFIKECTWFYVDGERQVEGQTGRETDREV